MTFRKQLPEYIGSDVLGSRNSDKYRRNEHAGTPQVTSPLRMFWLKCRAWALPALLSLTIVLFSGPITARVATSLEASESLLSNAEPPRKSTGLSDVVQWDNYTLFLHDQRVFIQYVYPLVTLRHDVVRGVFMVMRC